MDRFKQYLQQNKEALDVDKPGEDVWENVSRHLDRSGSPRRPAKRVSLPYRWAAAASVIVLIAASVYVMNRHANHLKSVSIQPSVNPSSPAASSSAASSSAASMSVVSAPVASTPVVSAPENRPAAVVKHAKPGSASPSDDGSPRRSDPLLAGLEKNYTSIIDAQWARVSRLPLFQKKTAYRADFSRQMQVLNQSEKTILALIHHNGMDNNLLQCLINIYQEKLDLLKRLQSENEKMSQHLNPKL